LTLGTRHPSPPREILVVTDINYPPFLFETDDGGVQGILKDKWALWSQRTGIPSQVRGMEWIKAQEGVQTGSADVIETLSYTEARAALYEFSPAYAPIEARVFFHRSIGGINDVASMRGFSIGAKEGMAHLALAVLQPGDGVLVPNPTYPIHSYSVVIADGDLRSVPLVPGEDFFARLQETARLAWPKAKLLILSFPHNPTTACVERDFFVKVVDFAREHHMMVVHDFAYADFTFDGYKAPSFLEIPGAKEVGVEIFSLSKSYNMPGWRVGFVCGNSKMIHALARIKSYLDYGAFQPIQIAAIIALEGEQGCVTDIVELHRKRRDVLVNGLNKIGWKVEKPRGTMFVWAPIPDEFRSMGSLEFSKLLIQECKVAVSPGIGFGEYGDGHVRFALVENEQRIRQALRGLKTLSGR